VTAAAGGGGTFSAGIFRPARRFSDTSVVVFEPLKAVFE
jgi:hypothetical protein